MRILLMGFILVWMGTSVQAQDASMQAMQAAQQINQIAIQQMQLATQTANQMMQLQMQLAAQQYIPAVRNPHYGECRAAMPKFSRKSGTYSSNVEVKIKDANWGAVIYYTTDGWTPSTASTRYTSPITIDSTTTLQAIAVLPEYGWGNRIAITPQCKWRSPVAIASYTLNGAPSTSPGAQGLTTSKAIATIMHSKPETFLLARDAAVPLVFASDVSSKTAVVGDKISLTLAEDLKTENVVLVRKGSPAVATVTEVDRHAMGLPDEIYFQVDYLQAGSVPIKLRGGAAKEGLNAEIKQGTSFTAFVDEFTLLSPTN